MVSSLGSGKSSFVVFLHDLPGHVGFTLRDVSHPEGLASSR